MNYLAYYEVLESAGWSISSDLEKLKGEWCFSMRIFEVPESFNNEELNKVEKPRFHKIKDNYKLIHSKGGLLHETE